MDGSREWLELVAGVLGETGAEVSDHVVEGGGVVAVGLEGLNVAAEDSFEDRRRRWPPATASSSASRFHLPARVRTSVETREGGEEHEGTTVSLLLYLTCYK